MPLFQWDLSNSELQTTIRLATQHWRTSTLLDKPWRSHLTAICTDWIAKHNSTASTTTNKKSPGDFSYTMPAIRDRFDGKATFLRSGASVYPKKHNVWGNPNVQIVSWMSLFQCDLSNSELQTHTQNGNTVRKFEKAWRSHSTAICTDWISKHSTASTTTDKKYQKVTWRPQLHCARKSRQIRRQSGDARNRRTSEPTFSATEPPFTRKNTMFGANPSVQTVSWMPLFQWDLSYSESVSFKIQSLSQLLCSTLLLCTWLFSTLLDSTSTPALCSALFFSTLLFSTLFYSTLLYSTLL